MPTLSLTEHPQGVSLDRGNVVTYELDGNAAHFGATTLEGHALVFGVDEPRTGTTLLTANVDLDPAVTWLIRCDRIDFPAGGIAYAHTHPGPGIRCQLFGSLTVSSAGHTGTYRRLEPWFESGPDPVYAQAGADEPAAFVRVLLLPSEWAGRRTIRYVNPADEEKPKLQKATVFVEEELEL